MMIVEKSEIFFTISHKSNFIHHMFMYLPLATVNHTQQPGLEAILDFDIFIEDSGALSSLLDFISF